MEDKLLQGVCRIQAALVREDGIEMTEVAALIALVVVAAAAFFGVFGQRMGGFVSKLPGLLGF
ncbi:MAG: hypothetical protein KKA73_10365 [Chloroflexi bacterium]|nr:hypothetical protein [Chloroflexota bacterium]MBU1748081.1 hypothetical protein [Chloroflexota bacterium]